MITGQTRNWGDDQHIGDRLSDMLRQPCLSGSLAITDVWVPTLNAEKITCKYITFGQLQVIVSRCAQRLRASLQNLAFHLKIVDCQGTENEVELLDMMQYKSPVAVYLQGGVNRIIIQVNILILNRVCCAACI